MKTKIKNYLFRCELRIKKSYDLLRKLPANIYNKIDKGEPKWILIFKRLVFKIDIQIPVKYFIWERARNKFLKSILPLYCKYESGQLIFLHTNQIPKGSNAIMEVKILKELLEANGFVKDRKIGTDEDAYNVSFFHKIYKNVFLYVYMDEMCDIEYIDVVEQKPIVTGMCAKILEELNTN